MNAITRHEYGWPDGRDFEALGHPRGRCAEGGLTHGMGLPLAECGP
jgi:hypothetical protein